MQNPVQNGGAGGPSFVFIVFSAAVGVCFMCSVDGEGGGGGGGAGGERSQVLFVPLHRFFAFLFSRLPPMAKMGGGESAVRKHFPNDIVFVKTNSSLLL